MVLRLILGDQLNYKHSWYTDTDTTEVCYFIAEMRQETDYTRHHIQKVVGFFLGMRHFADWLRDQQCDVTYYTLDDPRNTQDLVQNLQQLITTQQITRFEYQLPDEYRLDEQLRTFCDSLSIPTEAVTTEHFMTSRTDLAQFFKGKKQYTMEFFYRYMRKRYGILMQNEKTPEGGKWNFDHNNRKKWTGSPAIPSEKNIPKDVTDIVALLAQEGVATIGTIDAKAYHWPVTRAEAIEVLAYFCEHLLVHFGDYQDAMHPEQHYLFHSRLSFAMNSKLLGPSEIIHTVIKYWRAHESEIAISQVEGFVRQILGWREYMRGMYWMQMPDYQSVNYLQNTNPLPEFYWTGATKMRCMQHAIQQSLDHAYAHHIQRLMITGNYALLTMTDPDQVDQWYLGIYIDAIQWVEITNTRGMSQFADGGLVATKPYVSSGSYIHKMSGYCKGCHYKVTKKTEPDACPFNALYWNFLDEKKAYLQGNQRMKMMYNLLHKMDPQQLAVLKQRAHDIIQHPHAY